MKQIQLIFTTIITLWLASACQNRDLAQEERMTSLGETLGDIFKEKVRATEDATEEMEKQVWKSGASSEGKKIVKVAYELNKRTSDRLNQIAEIINYLTVQLGEKDAYGQIQNNYASNEIYAYMLGKEGEKLVKSLAGHQQYLQKKLMQSQKIKLATYRSPQKDFFEKHFKNSTVLGAVLVLRHLQIELLDKEMEVLKELYAKLKNIQRTGIVFNKIHAFVNVEKETVKVGETYKARVYVTNIGVSPDMKMYCNGSEIPVKEGIGKVKFKADKLGKQSWLGEIHCNIHGRDTTFKVKREFEVIE